VNRNSGWGEEDGCGFTLPRSSLCEGWGEECEHGGSGAYLYDASLGHLILLHSMLYVTVIAANRAVGMKE